MKKIIIISFILTLTSPLIAQGLESPIGPPDTDILNFTKTAGTEAGFNTSDPVTGLATLAGNIVAAFLSLIGVIFIVYTLYGGYLWMTAGGNDERVTKAKAIIRNGIVGMIIIFSVWGIYLVVAAIFNPDIESFPVGGRGF